VIAPSDWFVLAASFLGLGGLVGGGELLRRGGWAPTATRRLVHAAVGLFVVATPLLFSAPGPIYVLAIVFVLLNAGARAWRVWPGIHAARPESWGTVAMPLALMPALAATWTVGVDRLYILQAAFLTLALADPLSAWVGTSVGDREWIPNATVAGSGTFAVVSFGVLTTVLCGGGGWDLSRALGGAIVVTGVATAIEAIGQRGWDNLFVVLGIVLVLVPLHNGTMSLGIAAVSLCGGLAFGGAAYAGRTLDARGAVASGLFACSLVGLGGWGWAVPAVAFFARSSLLSRVDGPRNDQGRERQSGRTLRQVLANGGVAWGLLSVFVLVPTDGVSRTGCYVAFLGALAGAAADTWATELGAWTSARPRSLRTGARVPAGQSGAVSVGGTVAAALGAGSVAGAAVLASGGPVPIDWGTAGMIVGAGVAGMMADSLAGAFLQARYRDPETGGLVETPIHGGEPPVWGWAWVDNETVNAIGTTTGALVAFLLG